MTSDSVLRVLVADDHDVVRKGVLQTIVDEYPNAVTKGVSNFREILRAVTESAWDVLVLDINLPDKDGFEVLEEVKRHRPALPVIMLSSYSEPRVAVRSLRLGASGYVTKGSAADTLILAIRDTLAGRTYVTPDLARQLFAEQSGTQTLLPHEQLTPRELEVLKLVANGLTAKEIAARLGLSDKTVATYRARIAEKTKLRTGVEIARYAVQHGLIR
jgi:DNA-binding NarL/FixJ family response regulator